jgi:dTDP-4-dehydrorhamnose 3,5-epimerase-like enzyme
MKIKNYTPIKYNDSRGANNIYFEDIDEGICYKSSFSKKNVFRGLHIQIPPEPQEKYISVSKGKVLDFVLCLNSKSNDFGKIKSFTITPEKGFYKIPKYCAHGYLAEVDSVFDYICVGKYAETNEITIVMEDNFYLDKIISKKDKKGMGIDEALNFFKNINWE